MFARVHLCSLMFWLKYYFSKDIWELSDVTEKSTDDNNYQQSKEAKDFKCLLFV